MGLTCRQRFPDLLPADSTAVELGVAKGQFSEELLQSQNIKHLYSIDAWAEDRGHDNEEYSNTILRLKPYGARNTIIRLRFDKALELFQDEFFDFVYIDGYAHEGEEGGRTIHDWWPKVKPNGILAGHDYSAKWPLVVDAVDKFAAKHKLNVHTVPAESGIYTFPSWYVVKC